MKFGSGKWVFSVIVLAARDAARRFTFGQRSAARGRGSWHPLILQWRQRRRLQEKILTGRASMSTSVFSFPQFHFHYATHVSNRSAGKRALSFVPATDGPSALMVMDHRWTTVRTTGPTAPPGHDSNRFFRSSAYQISQPNRGSGVTTSPGRAHLADRRPIVPLVAYRPLVLQFLSTAKVGHTTPKMDERGQGFQSHSQTSERWLQIFRVRQPTLDYSLPHRSPERKSRQITFSEPEELLWRRANRPATEVPKDEVHQVASDYFEPTAARTFQRSEAIDQSPVSERAPLQITKLDPGLLDRLTDDVIRRVEQRARIERQRRGL